MLEHLAQRKSISHTVNIYVTFKEKYPKCTASPIVSHLTPQNLSVPVLIQLSKALVLSNVLFIVVIDEGNQAEGKKRQQTMA